MPDTNGHQDVDPEEAVNTKPLTACWPSVNRQMASLSWLFVTDMGCHLQSLDVPVNHGNHEQYTHVN